MNNKSVLFIIAFIVLSGFIVLSFKMNKVNFYHQPFDKINKTVFDCDLYGGDILREWVPSYVSYFSKNNMNKKIDNLKENLDDISIGYIDKYLDNMKYWGLCENKCFENGVSYIYTEYDKKLFKEFENIPFDNPYAETTDVHEFLYKSLYGMKDLPINVLSTINGKEIIDVGACDGDTAYMFFKYFPKSKIYAYEPEFANYKKMQLLVKQMKKNENCPVLIYPVNKALGNRKEIILNDDYGEQSTFEVNTIDNEAKALNLNNIGLIKTDVEGAEQSVLEGAKEVIAKQKPVLVFAMYHRAEDFFELKDKIKEINPDYKFMIRRSENVIADADLVLIAY